MDVLLHLGIPVFRLAGKHGEWQATHLLLTTPIAQFFTGVDDFGKRSTEGDFISIKEGPDLLIFT